MTVKRRAAFRRRFREIDRERFHLRVTDVPTPPERCNPVEELVHKVLKTCGLDEDVWARKLMENWGEIVGEHIARNARPGRIDRSTLIIFVTNSAWLSELSRYGKRQILQNIQSRFGKNRIRAVRLQLDPDLNQIKNVTKQK